MRGFPVTITKRRRWCRILRHNVVIDPERARELVTRQKMTEVSGQPKIIQRQTVIELEKLNELPAWAVKRVASFKHDPEGLYRAVWDRYLLHLDKPTTD